MPCLREKLAEGASSRTRLAAELCQRFRFQDARGQLRVGSCLKALRELERAGELPCRISMRRPQVRGCGRRHPGDTEARKCM